MFGELMAKYILALEKLPEPDDKSHMSRLQLLKREELLPYDISDIFHTIRKTGNKATHEFYESIPELLGLMIPIQMN
jgi:type I restriction enzyme, R subunit